MTRRELFAGVLALAAARLAPKAAAPREGGPYLEAFSYVERGGYHVPAPLDSTLVRAHRGEYVEVDLALTPGPGLVRNFVLAGPEAATWSRGAW